MFNLERELAEWRREMAAAGLNTPDIIRELEGHLRDDIEQQMKSGISGPAAFQAAVQRIGQPSVLKHEFDIGAPVGPFETLRQHKWKIVLCAAIGLLAATALHLLRPPPYQSQAKLLLRYQIPAVAVSIEGPHPLNFSTEQWATAMNAELEILTSMDLARQVTEKIGPEIILSGAGGGSDLIRATRLVKAGLSVEARSKSTVVRIAFHHPNPSVLQPVLREVIDQYLKLHVETHRAQQRLNDELGKAGVAPENFSAGVNMVTNISQIQSPSPPVSEFAKSLGLLSSVVAAGVVAGFVWVFGAKLHSDHSGKYRRVAVT